MSRHKPITEEVDTCRDATHAFKFKDDGTICHDTDTGSAGAMLFSHITGYIAVKVGTATRYIPLLTAKPSALD